MILDPDFLHHWKLKALSAAIGQAEAMTAVISLWSHCQNRKEWCFQINSRMLAGICEFKGDHAALLKEMVECGFLDQLEDGSYEVHGWAEKNSQLIHNWNAGKKGGRPPITQGVTLGKPLENPRVNPRKTQGVTDKIREDKRREEETEEEPSGPDTLVLSSDDQLPRKRAKGRASTMEEVVEYAGTQGCDSAGAEEFWDKMESCGWTRGGKKLVDWTAHFRNYFRSGYLITANRIQSKPKSQTAYEGRSFTVEDSIRALGGSEEDIQRREALINKYKTPA